MNPVGGIIEENEFFIYGYSENNKHLVFNRKLRDDCVTLKIDNINENYHVNS